MGCSRLLGARAWIPSSLQDCMPLCAAAPLTAARRLTMLSLPRSVLAVCAQVLRDARHFRGLCSPGGRVYGNAFTVMLRHITVALSSVAACEPESTYLPPLQAQCCKGTDEGAESFCFRVLDPGSRGAVPPAGRPVHSRHGRGVGHRFHI